MLIIFSGKHNHGVLAWEGKGWGRKGEEKIHDKIRYAAFKV